MQLTNKTPRIMLTSRCNLKCSYCSHGFVKSKYEDMPARAGFKVFRSCFCHCFLIAYCI